MIKTWVVARAGKTGEARGAGMVGHEKATQRHGATAVPYFRPRHA